MHEHTQHAAPSIILYNLLFMQLRNLCALAKRLDYYADFILVRLYMARTTLKFWALSQWHPTISTETRPKISGLSQPFWNGWQLWFPIPFFPLSMLKQSSLVPVTSYYSYYTSQHSKDAACSSNAFICAWTSSPEPQ